MDLRREEVAEILTKFLERFSPPRQMLENKDAQQAEAELLLKVLLRYAPNREAGHWTRRVLNVVAERMKTRAWPLASEVGAVAKDFRPQQKAKSQFEWSLDPIKINATRINEGQRVGDEWLYGKRAYELIESGLVTAQMIENYRYHLFKEEKNTVGNEIALKRDEDRRSRHEQYYSEVGKMLAAE